MDEWIFRSSVLSASSDVVEIPAKPVRIGSVVHTHFRFVDAL